MAVYKAYAFFTAAKAGKTGLTVTVDVFKAADDSQVVTNQAANEVAGGLYSYSYTNATDDDFLFVFKTADTSVDAQHVPALAITPTWSAASRTLTQTAASVVAAVSGSDITAHRGDTLTASLTGLGAINTRSKLWFTVKRDRGDADTAAVLMIEETAGLTVVNGAVYATVTDGSLVVTNETTGAVTITIKPAVTDDLSGRGLYYDIQMLTAAGVVTTLTNGEFDITEDVTRAIA